MQHLLRGRTSESLQNCLHRTSITIKLYKNSPSLNLHEICLKFLLLILSSSNKNVPSQICPCYSSTQHRPWNTRQTFQHTIFNELSIVREIMNLSYIFVCSSNNKEGSLCTIRKNLFYK